MILHVWVCWSIY